jgi:hypothetical protein
MRGSIMPQCIHRDEIIETIWILRALAALKAPGALLDLNMYTGTSVSYECLEVLKSSSSPYHFSCRSVSCIGLRELLLSGELPQSESHTKYKLCALCTAHTPVPERHRKD